MKTRIILTIAGLALISMSAFAQKKPDCSIKKLTKACTDEQRKKACGPGDTKVAEAAVITRLREDLLVLYNKINENEESNEANYQGNSDDESLALLQTGFIELRKRSGLDPIEYESTSKAKLIQALSADVKVLDEALNNE